MLNGKLLFERDDKIEVGLGTKEDAKDVESYSQLVRYLIDQETVNTAEFLSKIEGLSFVEDSEEKYNNLAVGVSYKQLPAVINGEVLVKVVLLTQGEAFALIMPEGVATAYQTIIEDPDTLTEVNVKLSLYVEVCDFDTDDPKFADLVKSAYISAGDSTNAFEFTGIRKKKKADGDTEGSFDDFDMPAMGGSKDTGGMGGMSEIPEPVEEFPEIDANMEAYKGFKSFSSGSLIEAAKSWINRSSGVVNSNTKIKMLKDCHVLVIEVNNKAIYDKLKNSPSVAKRTISSFGEMIRLNKETQLVDSFQRDGKRYFVVVEDHGGNFWVVKKERLYGIPEDSDYVEPIQKDIVKLSRSGVRVESRKRTPHRKGRIVVFS